jgi:LacI family transcriptional regulator
VILPDSANPFFAEVARGIQDTGFKEGYSVIICNTDNNQEKENLYVSVLSEKQVDGIIFVSAGESTQAILALQEQKRPFVIVDRRVPNAKTDSVMTDNARGGELAAEHLFQLGHRRIGCISGSSTLSPSAERLTGYYNALKARDLPLDETLIVRGDFHYRGGYVAEQQLLNFTDPPTPIFAFNDLMAVGAIAAAQKLGLRVPEDLSVIGFDDIDLTPYMFPPLTTVAQPKHQMGVLATNLLFKRIQERDLSSRVHTLDVSLIVRQSTACLKA